MKKIKFLNGIGSMFAFAVVALVGSLLFTSCEKEDLNATFTTEPAKATINVNVVEFPSGAAVSGVTISADTVSYTHLVYPCSIFLKQSILIMIIIWQTSASRYNMCCGLTSIFVASVVK